MRDNIAVGAISKLGGFHMASKDKLTTLSDSDIETQRNVSRRSALSTIGGIGVGVGAAAAALLVGTTPAAASDPINYPCQSKRHKGLKTRCTDRD
jgi:hypothetical protein